MLTLEFWGVFFGGVGASIALFSGYRLWASHRTRLKITAQGYWLVEGGVVTQHCPISGDTADDNPAQLAINIINFSPFAVSIKRVGFIDIDGGGGQFIFMNAKTLQNETCPVCIQARDRATFFCNYPIKKDQVNRRIQPFAEIGTGQDIAGEKLFLIRN